MPDPMSGSGEGPGMIGRSLGEFIVREPLSSGGFGTVYRAEQPALAREAVIKVLHRRLLGSETMVHRFLREARLASRLDHPYAAHTYAFGAEPDGLLWIAMELVRGTPLDRLLRVEGPITLDRFVPLLERICEVVHSAHEQGIIHRDLKPANVMVLERSGRLLPKLLDFGIAKLRTVDGDHGGDGPTTIDDQWPTDQMLPAFGKTDLPAGAQTEESGDTLHLARTPVTPVTPGTPSARGPTGGLTEVGTTVGSPLYMAPEQWTDAALVDERTDIYALGVLCHESLTGTPPFRGDTAFEIALAHASGPIPSLGSDFPPELDEVLARALAKLKADRYSSALELAAAFRVASGVEREPIPLPRVDSALRASAMIGLPRPLALAVDAFDAARNAHQARDACWQLVRTAIRTVSVIALAAHGHVQDPAGGTAVDEQLRRLRERQPTDGDWLAVARALTRPFAGLRDAHPVAGLVELLTRPRSALDDLLQLRGEAERGGGASEEQVVELIEKALPMIVHLLEDLSFLYQHPIAVPGERGSAEEWVGVRRDRRPRRLGVNMPAGRAVLLDGTGEVAVMLWPFVQVHAPAPGSPPALFLFDGRGRRGARLVALPDPFEHEDDELWETFGAMLSDTAESLGEVSDAEVCPYPGLAAFTGDDAASFFGRERESEAFLNRLRVQPLLTVVGPSGAGKSSFVQAGVLPALPDSWQSVAVRPGPTPLIGLAARLEGLGIDAHGDPADIAASVRAWCEARDTTLVLFVDQLEELFTICQDAAERARYGELLARAARSVDDPVRVVLTVRDDFLLRLESLPALRERLGPGLQLLTTPAEPELRRILTEPLRRAGYEIDDPGLPDRIVSEVAGRPGALALLSFTASKLWELRDRRFRHITARAYDSLAGVGGALAQHAESTLVAMHPEQQRLVREVFRHAVTAEGTRAVLTRAELTEVLGASAHAGHVVEKLLAARLLVVSDDERGGERVEITHEALLEAWPRLVAWRREDVEGARLRDQLRAAARQWTERNRPSGLLWRGDALAEYRIWRGRVPGGLTAAEEAFAAASLAEAARGRRIRGALLAAAFLALAGFAVVMLFQNASVERQRSRARASAEQLQDLLRNQYEDQGRRLLLNEDPTLALAYLHKAAQLGARGQAHDFLIADAVRATEGQLLELRHDGNVNRVRFSPDGASIATAGDDNRVRIWDARSGALRRELIHKGPVHRVEWSPSGDRIATGAADGAFLWDASGRRLHQLKLPAPVQALAFADHGAALVTATVEDEVTVWSPTSGERIATLRDRQEPALALAESMLILSPDGRQIAAGDRGGTIRLWDLQTRQMVSSWHAHKERIVWLAFSPDGGQLVSASEGSEPAPVWNVATQRRQFSLSHRAQIASAEFSPDGQSIVTASPDRTAALWSATDGQPIGILTGHAAGVTRAVWSADGSTIVTAGEDGSPRLWEIKDGRRLARWFGHRGRVTDVAFDPHGRRVATSGADGRVIVWSTRPQQQIQFLRGHEVASVWSIEFSPTGGHVLTACADQTARIWDATTGRELLVLRHPASLAIARYSPDGQRVATGADDGAVRIWDAGTGALLDTMTGHKAAVGSIGWERGGTRLVSGDIEGGARIWSMATGELIRELDGHGGKPVLAAAFHPTRPVIMTVAADAAVEWEAGTGRRLRRIENRNRRRSVFDRAGVKVLSATVNRSAEIWRFADGGTETELIGHLGTVRLAAFSPDDAFAVTASFDESARIWDAKRGELLAVLAHKDAWVNAVAFSPDGARVATARGDGVAEIWQLPRRGLEPKRLDDIVRCRAPYDTAGDQIVLRARDPATCAQTLVDLP